MSTEAVIIIAEEILAKQGVTRSPISGLETYLPSNAKNAMVEFAKLHVEAALKAAINQLPVDDRLNRDIFVMDKITNCYPLTNIK